MAQWTATTATVAEMREGGWSCAAGVEVEDDESTDVVDAEDPLETEVVFGAEGTRTGTCALGACRSAALEDEGGFVDVEDVVVFVVTGFGGFALFDAAARALSTRFLRDEICAKISVVFKSASVSLLSRDN